MDVTFATLHHGPNVEQARLIAVTTNEAATRDLAMQMLSDLQDEDAETDPVVDSVRQGRIKALRILCASQKGELK